MNISTELIISISLQIITLSFFVGVYVTTVKFISKQIDELKQQSKDDKDELKTEMRRYNNVLSRLAVAENSISSAHHRIDNLEEKE
jgi:hypothetical protein